MNSLATETYREAGPPLVSDATQTPWLSGYRVLTLVAMLALYAVLGLLYDRIVAPRYAFGAFQVNARSDSLLEIITVIAAALVLPVETRKMSQIFAWLSTVFLLVPAAVLSSHQGSDRGSMFLMFGGVWLVMLLCRVLNDFDVFFGVDTTPRRAKIDITKLLAILLTVFVMLAYHVGGKVSFSFAEVYLSRFEFNESVGFPLNYLLPFAAGPLAGLIVAAALYRKNYIVLAIVMVMGALFFGMSTHKAMLFYPPFVAAIYLAIGGRAGQFYMMGVFFALAILTFMTVGSSFEDLLGSAFANRLVFIPAQIHYFFFREFGEIGPQLWAESRIGLGLHKPDIPMPSVNYIGLIMTGDPQVGANTGWIANGYMNAGWFGIAIYAVILAFVLHVMDRLGARYGYNFVGAAFLIPIFNVVNSIDLLVGFLTGGLLLLSLLFYWFVRPEDDDTEGAEAA